MATMEQSDGRRRFEQYRLASGLSKESEEHQISTLLYCLGEDSEDVLDLTKISAEDRKKYEKVLSQFDNFFKVRKNIIFERSRFNRRNQSSDESAEQYITCLHQLADNCEYGEMKDEMIRDRLVVGIKDQTLSECLQMEPDLTLDKAKKMVRQREAVKEQQVILKGSTEGEKSLEVVKTRRRQPTGRSQVGPRATTSQICKRCSGELRPGSTNVAY